MCWRCATSRPRREKQSRRQSRPVRDDSGLLGGAIRLARQSDLGDDIHANDAVNHLSRVLEVWRIPRDGQLVASGFSQSNTVEAQFQNALFDGAQVVGAGNA